MLQLLAFKDVQALDAEMLSWLLASGGRYRHEIDRFHCKDLWASGHCQQLHVLSKDIFSFLSVLNVLLSNFHGEEEFSLAIFSIPCIFGLIPAISSLGILVFQMSC